MPTGELIKGVDAAQPTEPRAPWFGWADIVKLALTALVAVAGTSATGARQQSDLKDSLNAKIAVIEARQEAMMREIVPRNEHVAQWKSLEQQNQQLREDIRELRAVVVRLAR
jgi:TolA-binding protein